MCRSARLNLGAVVRLERLEVTLDAYRVDIDDRIVLSENLTQANVRAYLTSQGFDRIGGGRFFINGVDTHTQGVDLSMTYPIEFTSGGRLAFTFAANFNSTDVERVPSTTQLSQLNPAPVLFDRVNVLTFEDGDPKNKLSAVSTWSHGRWGATVRAVRYGDVLSPDTAATFATLAGGTAPNDVLLTAKTLFDLEARVDLAEHVKLALGAENLFDEYPQPNPAAVNGTGTASFSNYSPFGRSGRFLYGRISVNF